MSIVKVLCPECDKEIEVDNANKAGLCPHCNKPFVTQDAIDKYKKQVQAKINQEDNDNKINKEGFYVIKDMLTCKFFNDNVLKIDDPNITQIDFAWDIKNPYKLSNENITFVLTPNIVTIKCNASRSSLFFDCIQVEEGIESLTENFKDFAMKYCNMLELPSTITEIKYKNWFNEHMLIYSENKLNVDVEYIDHNQKYKPATIIQNSITFPYKATLEIESYSSTGTFKKQKNEENIKKFLETIRRNLPNIEDKTFKRAKIKDIKNSLSDKKWDIIWALIGFAAVGLIALLLFF